MIGGRGEVHAWLSMSMDACVAGPNDHPGNPLGDGGERLHDWFITANGSSEGPTACSVELAESRLRAAARW